MGNCKDGKCGIKNSNSISVKRDEKPISPPKFNIGDDAYTARRCDKGKEIHFIFKKNKVLAVGVFVNYYIYTLDKKDEKVFEKDLYTLEYIERQMQCNPLFCSIEI